MINGRVNARHIINEEKDLSKTISPIFYEYHALAPRRTTRCIEDDYEDEDNAPARLRSPIYRFCPLRSIHARDVYHDTFRSYGTLINIARIYSKNPSDKLLGIGFGKERTNEWKLVSEAILSLQ